MKNLKQDKLFMQIALDLARKGTGRVSPNPRVGAVVVKSGKVVGKGYHRDFGGPHAEVHALEQAGRRAKGATLYVTLEPCSSYGKTPPCLEKIVASQVERVVVATEDPNPKHAGKGLRLLKKKGIAITQGIEEERAKELIRYFGHWIVKKEPYVMVKEAMSLDGKIATQTGDSRWISSEESRKWVHQLRSEVDAILVGKNTVLKDDPQLTCRLSQWRGEQPLRFVLCADGKIEWNKNIFSNQSEALTFLVVTKKITKKEKADWEKKGILLVQVPEKNKKIDLSQFLKIIGKIGVTSLLVEGGGETVASFFEAKKVNQLFLFVAPKIVGGREAPSPVEGDGILKMTQALKPKSWSHKRVGPDLLIEALF